MTSTDKKKAQDLAAMKATFRSLLEQQVALGKISSSQAVDLLSQMERAPSRRHAIAITNRLHRLIGNSARADSRAHPRYPCSMMLRLPVDGKDMWHFIQNICQGGLAYCAVHPAPVSKVVRLELADPDTGESYRCTGRIAWHEPRIGRAGVEFVEVDPALQALLPKLGERFGKDRPAQGEERGNPP